MLHRVRERNFWLVITTDAVLLCCAYYLSYWLRFDTNIPQQEMTKFLDTIGWIVALKLVIFIVMNLYAGMWRYTGLPDILNILKANLLTLLIITLIIGFGVQFRGFSRGAILIDFILTVRSTPQRFG